MDLLERSRQLIFDHTDSLQNYQEELLDYIERACNAIVESLLQDGKVFTCANGIASSLGEILTLSLIDQFERERPGLPAINLGVDNYNLSEMARDNRFSDSFAKPLRTLASNKDILIVFSLDGDCNNLVQAVQAAHDKEMRVIAMIGAESSNLGSIMLSDDILINLWGNQKSIFLQNGVVVSTLLLDLIDCTLFGAPH